MKRLLTLAALVALSLACLASVLCLSGCRDNGGAQKLSYRACMDKARDAGVLNPTTQPEIDAACQNQAQQAQ